VVEETAKLPPTLKLKLPADPAVLLNVCAPLALGNVEIVIGVDPLGPLRLKELGTLSVNACPPSPATAKPARLGDGEESTVAPEPVPGL
jgi:hypothetical protein